MKRNLFVILIGLGLLACTKESDVAVTCERTLDVNVSDATRIQLDGNLNTVWNAGDSVSVFYKGGSGNDLWRYAGSDKSSSGKIICSDYSLVFSDGMTYAIYPYSSSYSIDSSKVSLSIPSEQRFVDGSYDFTVMAAKTDGDALNFKYAVSMVCLAIEGSAIIDSIVLRGNASEPLCGPGVLDMSGAVPVVVLDSVSSGREIVLCGDAGTPAASLVKSTARAFVAVPAGTYSQGFTADVFYSNGTKSVIRHTMSVTLAPGQYLLIDDFVDESYVVTLAFASDPQTTASILYSFPTSTKMAGKTVDVVNSYDFGTPYTFQLWAKTGFCKSTRDNGARILWLQLNPYENGYSWLRIPAIPGWKLDEIRMSNSANKSNTFNVSSFVAADGSGSGDLYPDTVMSLPSFVFHLNTPTSSPCYFCFGNQTSTLVSYLTFVYRRE